VVSVMGPACGSTVMLLTLCMIAVLCGPSMTTVCDLSGSSMVATGMAVSPYNCVIGKPVEIPASEYTTDLLF
jgi:hypothetical protein